MVAALFALHPMNVESVAWAAERKNCVEHVVFLLTVYAYVWYHARAEYRSGMPQWRASLRWR